MAYKFIKEIDVNLLFYISSISIEMSAIFEEIEYFGFLLLFSSIFNKTDESFRIFLTLGI